MMKNKLLSIWIGCGSVLCSYTSCSKEMEFIDSPNEQVTIQLTTTIDYQGFSTDNEIIPMKTRSTRSTDYYVTAIYDSRLVIIKETGQSAWSIEKIEDNVIPQGYIKSSDACKYTMQTTLRPGNYKFMLLVNGPKNEALHLYQSFSEEDVPWLTDTEKDYSGYEIFFATSGIVTIKKTDRLEESGQYHPLPTPLVLKRYSSLIRLCATGDGFWGSLERATDISYSIKEQSINGINLLGQIVSKDTELSFGTLTASIRKNFECQLGDKKLFFSYFGDEDEAKQLQNILTPSDGKDITVTIFQKEKQTPPIETTTQAKPNQVTTLILDKTESVLNWNQSPIIGTPIDWDPDNIPWGHLELNFL